MGKFNITQTNSITNVTYPQPVVDRYLSPILINNQHIGGTGGKTSQPGLQIQPNVKVGTNTVVAGSILAQKGVHKFRVTDGTNTGTCKLVNLPIPTVASTMSIQINTAQTTAFANLTVPNSGSTNTFGWITFATANLNAYTTPTTSSVWAGTGFQGTASVISYNVANGLANANVSFSSQTVSSVSNTGTYQTVVYTSRISDKYVYDFGNDGYPVTSTSGSFTGGPNNPNRYAYWLYAPSTRFVQVAAA